jgi:hypothetical protein
MLTMLTDADVYWRMLTVSGGEREGSQVQTPHTPHQNRLDLISCGTNTLRAATSTLKGCC